MHPRPHPSAAIAGRLSRWGVLAWAGACLLLSGGCTTTSLVLGVAGVATDTSIPWAVTKHLYAKMTEGDPVLCIRLNSVQRALSQRCGSFREGSIEAKDIANSELQECPLTIAAQDPQFWPVLPELISKGARPQTCYRPPLVALARSQPCPDFSAASPEQLQALTWLASNDDRSVQHDVVRLLSCPGARKAQLDNVIAGWWTSGRLAADQVGFGVLGAFHPDYLRSPLAQELESHGHTARAALGGYERKLPSGFEEALRTSHWKALGWWFDRMPELVNRVPATSGNQLAWVPLAKVLVPSFLADPDDQKEMIDFLLARGANPWQRLPFNPGMTVVAYARSMNSPYATLLDLPSNDLANRRSLLATRDIPPAP